MVQALSVIHFPAAFPKSRKKSGAFPLHQGYLAIHILFENYFSSLQRKLMSSKSWVTFLTFGSFVGWSRLVPS